METNMKSLLRNAFLIHIKKFSVFVFKKYLFLTLRNKSSYNNNMDIYVKCKTLLSIKKNHYFSYCNLKY